MLMQRFEALSHGQQAMASAMSTLAMADSTDAPPELRVVVYSAPWCLREGSFVFNQFLNDERLMFRRRYALMDKLSAVIAGRCGAPAPPSLPDLHTT